MARKCPSLTYRILVPDGEGGHRPIEELTPAEREAFSNRIVETLGKGFNDYFGLHPEVYEKI